MDEILEKQDEIRVLDFPENIRSKFGMYIDSPDTMLREIIDNSTDEVLSSKQCNKIFIDTNFNGYNIVADNGRGVSIAESKDRPGMIQADVSISVLHAGSKFVNSDSKIGTYGVGSSAVNALSSNYILMSKITPDNYKQSLPWLVEYYESLGPRSKKEVYYIVWYKQGYKYYEGAAKKSDIEKQLFQDNSPKGWTEIPEGYSTLVLFQVDPEIFPKVKTNIPIENIQNFLLIQEKFYKKKVTILANGEAMTSSGFKPYRYEILKTITPEDTSKNPYLGVYITFEIDPSLSPKDCKGSVNGLTVSQGVHINYVEQCYELALRNEFKITHKYIFPGFKMFMILLAEDLVYGDQVKSRLKQISKVRAQDFVDIVKEFAKVFRRDPEYWGVHVGKLNSLADSMRSLTAVEKANKIMAGSTGNQVFKSKQDFVEGFSDATAPSGERWNAELFLCFTGDTEMLTCNNERISMVDLERRLNSGEEIYTFSCKQSGRIIPAKVVAARQVSTANKLCKVTLDNGESFTCTPNHQHMMRDGSYKEAKDLTPGDSMMPCYITTDDINFNTKRFSKIEDIRRGIIDMSREGKLRGLQSIDKCRGYRSTKKKYPELIENYSARLNRNHKIVSVEFIQVENIPVYCLEVNTEEHNFPLAAGIFTKNCEGLSAAGGLKSGRKDTRYHAVLPLRGKILNVKDSSIDEALENKEIYTIMKVIGLGLDVNNVTTGCKSPEEAFEKIRKHTRFGKICISTDADSDGSHITILILYLFSKYARFLVDYGLVYIALSPLFKQGDKYFYPNDPLVPGTTIPVGLDTTKPFHRWKGLGSLNKEEVYDAFYNPETRRLVQVTPEGLDYAMSLVEDINARKNLLFNAGILSNPYGFTDI